MDPIAQAIAHLHHQDVLNISEASRLFKIDRSKLSRRWRGITESRAVKAEKQCLLSRQQERTLVAYINKLTERGLPPTSAMLRNFVYDIINKHPQRGWTSKFCKRWSGQIGSRYLQPVDNNRKIADNESSYTAYFDLVRSKIAQYKIKPENTYNMDKKSFLIGLINKSKRIFSKKAYKDSKTLRNR